MPKYTKILSTLSLSLSSEMLKCHKTQNGGFLRNKRADFRWSVEQLAGFILNDNRFIKSSVPSATGRCRLQQDCIFDKAECQQVHLP